MQNINTENLYKAITRALLYAALLIVVLWFLFKIINVILLILLALILVLIINVPVAWLEKKKIRRGWACLIVFALIAGGTCVALLAYCSQDKRAAYRAYHEPARVCGPAFEKHRFLVQRLSETER
jgi:predicted PurR-regulated permease PerM